MDRDEILNQIRLQTKIVAGDVADADIVTLINQGVQEIAVMDDWPWLEETVAISLVDSQQAYTLPADFNRAKALVDDDIDTTLIYLSPGKFFNSFGNDTGNESPTPKAWTIWEGSIYINPIPQDNDSNRLTLYYYENPASLSTGASTTQWDTAFDYVLVEYVKWKLYEREEIPAMADRSRGQYYSQIQDMIHFYKDRVQWPPFIYGDGTVRRVEYINIPNIGIP